LRGLHRAADDEWSFEAFERAVHPDADRAKAIGGPHEARTQPSAPKQRRIRRPSLESQVRQLWKAAHAAGVQIAVTIEGDTVTATPTRGAAAPSEQPQADAPSSRSLFKARAVPKVKVVL
jgi:hypothetical protein